MKSRYATVESGVVTNVVIWDGAAVCDELLGAVRVPDVVSVGVGYTFVDGEFVAPQTQPDEPEFV